MEEDLWKELDIDEDLIVDQLTIFRFAFGYKAPSRAQKNSGVHEMPLSMDLLAHIILKEIEEHKAESDCINQVRAN